MDWKGQIWRQVMVLSACANIVAVIVAIWLYLSMRDTAEVMRDARVMCISPSNPNFDQIAAIASQGRFDMVSGIFTAFAIVLAFGGFVSISIFRREVIGEARDEVARLVPDEVRRIQQNLYPTQRSDDGGQVYTPSDVPYIGTGENDDGVAPQRAASDDTPASESDPGSGDSDGARPGH